MGLSRARPLEAGAAHRLARGPGRVLAAVLALAGSTLAAVTLATQAGAAPAFKIDLEGAFLAPLSPHAAEGGDPIHERVTEAAIRSVTPDASPILILNVQRGVQNTDVTHQWDGEYHFDDASVELGIGFAKAFAAVRRHLESARKRATGNPQFLDPTFTSFKEIADVLERTLRELARHPACVRAGNRCTTAFARPAARLAEVRVSTAGVRLERNPFPDPHRPTDSASLFATPRAGARCGLCGFLGPVSAGYVSIVRETEAAARRAVTDVRTWIPSRSDPKRRMIELTIPDALDAYRAFQDLGHAFHATQDFFAHTNYVELQARVPVGTAIPPGTVIPLPSDFAGFSLQGFAALLAQERPQIGGTLFDELESGAVPTSWLGGGDFCAGNIFNPAGGPVKLKLVGLTLPGGGKNTDPPRGFTYCHYKTKTAMGLNKDEPPSKDPSKNEPSYVNHVVARDAALRMSVMLWQSFLASVEARCPQGGSSCPPTGEVTDIWGGSWELAIQGAQWTPGSSTACCLVLGRLTEEQGRPLVGQPFGDRVFGPCPDPTTFYSGLIDFGAGGEVLACTSTDQSFLHAFFRAIPAPLPQQYTPLQDGATLELLSSRDGTFVGTWTPQTFSLNLTGRCVFGKCVPVAAP